MTDVADAQAWAAWAFAEADHWRKEAHYKHACWLMAMSDCGKAIEQEKARADVSESANDALRELLKEQRRRTEVAEELLRRSDTNLSRMGEDLGHLQATRNRQGKRILGLIAESNRRLDRLGKLRAQLRDERNRADDAAAQIEKLSNWLKENIARIDELWTRIYEAQNVAAWFAAEAKWQRKRADGAQFTVEWRGGVIARYKRELAEAQAHAAEVEADYEQQRVIAEELAAQVRGDA